MKEIWAVTRKELRSYFVSPMAMIFIGTFLAVTLFVFFWVDAFFSRGIADVRPLFHWMPLLLIFLIAALTMRQWSEEERSGTLEILATLPVSTTQLVLGKFLAVVILVAVALALTLFLPITVAIIGNLDWGPVVGGYLAALLLASAYAAIGLFLSSRTDNQIVALIGTILVGGLFYVIGTPGVTDFFGQRTAALLRALSTSARFESIQRGVVDLRDLLYYLALTGLFLTLNVLSLKSKGWSHTPRTEKHRRAVQIVSLLVVLNLILLNVWTYPIHAMRLDLTSDRIYSLSPATKKILGELQEPLLIRGYFSEKTHPLLAPLVPQIEDLLREYEIASNGKIKLEFVDPTTDPNIAAEAEKVYGIRPTPFQVEGRYEAAVINAYFDILIQYGDQSEVLGFRDLVQVQPNRDGTLDVSLRNPEYDITRTIKKVVYGFRSVDAVFAALEEPAHLTLFVTKESLPDELKDAPETIRKVAEQLAAESNGKFVFQVVDPDAPDSPVTRQDLYDKYGLRPFAVSPFSDQTYYLDMLLEVNGEQSFVVPQGGISEATVRQALEDALKRAVPGFLQVVGVWTPSEEPQPDLFGQMQEPFSTWRELRQALGEEYEVEQVDLSTGVVPPEVDVLVVVAPQELGDKGRYAIDQFLMRGGSLIIATSAYHVAPDYTTGGLMLLPLADGVDDLLQSYGVEVEKALVMDLQSDPFPIAVTRQVNGQPVQQLVAIQYPFFVDVRPEGMAQGHPIVANLPAVSLAWASPLKVDEAKNADRQVTVVLQSSGHSWVVTDTNIEPDPNAYPQYGFPVPDASEMAPQTLAVAIQGRFESAFKDQPSPLEGEGITQTAQTPAGRLDVSTADARLFVVGSCEFVDDLILDLASYLGGDRYVNNLKLMQNAAAWGLEDTDLLSIRARGATAHLLKPLSPQEERLIETANYLLALLSLFALGLFWSVRLRHPKPLPIVPPDEAVEGMKEVEA